MTESKGFKTFIFIRSAQAAAAYAYRILQMFYFPRKAKTSVRDQIIIRPLMYKN